MILNGSAFDTMPPGDAKHVMNVARLAALPTDVINSGETYVCQWKICGPEGKTLLMSPDGRLVAVGDWPANEPLTFDTCTLLMKPTAKDVEKRLKMDKYEPIKCDPSELVPRAKRPEFVPPDFGAPIPEPVLPHDGLEPVAMMATLDRTIMEEWRRVRAALQTPPTPKTASPHEFESILMGNKLFGKWFAYWYDSFFVGLSDDDRAGLGLYYLKGVKRLSPAAKADLESLFLRLTGDT